MNGRMALLILVTGLFMRVWASRETGDDSRAHDSEPALQAAGEPGVSSLIVDLGEPVLFPDDQPGRRPTAATRTSFHHPIPLPEGIAPGTYRVVDNTGSVDRIEIAQRPGGGASPGPVYELYMKTAEGRQWYFIRLRESEKSQAAAEPGEDEFPLDLPQSPAHDAGRGAFQNRKFDFTPYLDDGFEAVEEQPAQSAQGAVEL